MLKKLCDNCKTEMDIDSDGLRVEINTSKNENLELFADLCEKCEKDLVEAILTTLNSYGVKNEIEQAEEEEEEEELNEDSY